MAWCQGFDSPLFVNVLTLISVQRSESDLGTTIDAAYIATDMNGNIFDSYYNFGIRDTGLKNFNLRVHF